LDTWQYMSTKHMFSFIFLAIANFFLKCRNFCHFITEFVDYMLKRLSHYSEEDTDWTTGEPGFNSWQGKGFFSPPECRSQCRSQSPFLKDKAAEKWRGPLASVLCQYMRTMQNMVITGWNRTTESRGLHGMNFCDRWTHCIEKCHFLGNALSIQGADNQRLLLVNS
jgi:hypothetical protein